MSAYTNAVTNITDESKFYVYPMAASLRGGAVESEFNIRNLMTCLFNKSAAKTDNDFILYYNVDIDGQKPALETYNLSQGNSSWYEIDEHSGYCTLKNIAVGPGEGNCNGYYTRLYDYTPITSTHLNINNLIQANEGYTPLLPTDLQPSWPISAIIYNSLEELKSADSSNSVHCKDDYGNVLEYVIPGPDGETGSYIDGTSARVKTTNGTATYIIYYTKHNDAWILSSDIIPEYSYNETDSTSTLEGYRVYSDRKYFKLDKSSKSINAIAFTNGTTFTDAEGNKYTFVSASEELYKIATATQKFNVVLGLNWTINQLVSSAQISICENSTIIEQCQEEDITGVITTTDYTEFERLNKHLHDLGLLDAGIVLGTITISKRPIYNVIDGIGSYSWTYSCVYEGNRYKTACIDLAKLGTDTDNLGENMYDKINRLYTLMIDSGSFKIGTVLRNSGFDKNPESANHNFMKCIAPYKLDLGLTDFELGTGQNYANGYLRIVNYNEEFNGAAEVDTGYIFKCRIKLNPRSGEPEEIESITLCNDGITCFNDNIVFNHKVDIYDENRHKGGLPIFYVHGKSELMDSLSVYGDVTISDGNYLTFGNFESKLTATDDGLITDRLQVSNKLTATELNIPNTLEVTDAAFDVKTNKLSIKSSTGNINTSGTIYSNGLYINTDKATITSEGVLTANRVYGAVWN